MRTIRKKLSEHVIRSLVASDVREIVDTHTPGLMYRYHSRRTTGSFYAYIYRSGRMLSSAFARWPTHCVDDARGLLSVEIDKLHGRRDSGALSEFETVADLMDWYRERVSKQSDISIARKRSISAMIENRISRYIGDVTISEITARVIDDNFWLPLQSKYSLSTVSLTLRTLKQAFSMAHARGLIQQNPVVELKQTTFTKISIRPKEGRLKPYQVAQVLDAVSELSNASVLVLLLLMCGSRIGETRQAKISEFDLTAGAWHIPKSHTKARRAYTVALSCDAISLLIKYRQKQALAGYLGPYLFPDGCGRSISERTATRLVRTISLGCWSAHDLRKLFRSRLDEQGTQYLIAESMVNHALTKLEQTYVLSADAFSSKQTAIAEYQKWLNASGMNVNKLE